MTQDSTQAADPAPADDLTPAVHALLARFHRQAPLDEVAHLDWVRSLAFDGSPASIARVDAMLAAFRRQHRPDYATFMAEAGQRGFIRLLGCLVGEATARYLGRSCRWFGPAGLRSRFEALGIDEAPPSGFAGSLACEIDGQGFLLPLGSVEAGLFAEHPPGVLKSADALMRRTVEVERLQDPGSLPAPSPVLERDPAWALGQALGLVANFLIDDARRGTSPVGPLALHRHPGGSGVFHSYAFWSGDYQGAVASGRDRLAAPEDGAAAAVVLGHDGYLSLPAFRSDAIWLEGVWWPAAAPGVEGPLLRVRVALPFRPVDGDRDLALHDIRLIDFSGDGPAARRLRAGLFMQLTREELVPPGAWRRDFIDEDDPAIVALRQKALPIPPWQAGPAADPAPAPAVTLDDFDLARIRSLGGRADAGADAGEDDAAPATGTDPAPGLGLDTGPGALPDGMQVPFWLLDTPLAPAIRGVGPLLRKGRATWGRIVQANTQLFEHGSDDLPAAIVYSLDGAVDVAVLERVARALFALRQELPPDADPALRRIGEMLAAEKEHVFGWPVPAALAPLAGVDAALLEALRLSAIWIVRAHLPMQRLLTLDLPLLVSDSLPGRVAVVPANAWPAPLLRRWEEIDRLSRVQRWLDHIGQLATQRLGTNEDEDQGEIERHQRALAAFVDDGISIARIRSLADLDDTLFPYGTRPPPMEWEWILDAELRSRAERLLVDLEAGLARGEAFDALRARRVFAARASALWIALHRQALTGSRGALSSLHRIEPDEIQYVALGFVSGCDAFAERLARPLVGLLGDTTVWQPFWRPEVCAVFRLFAGYLRMPLPSLEPFARRPALDALLDGEAWRGDVTPVAELLQAACVEHIERAPIGPFVRMPIVLLLIQRLRERAGLPVVPVRHDLLCYPPGPATAPVTTNDWAGALNAISDPLTRQVLARMRRTGYDEGEIEMAFLQRRAPATRTALARPRPAR